MPISNKFERIQIHLFDINILPTLLTAPRKTIGNPSFQLLADKGLYDKFQAADEFLKTEHFICQNFPKKFLRNSALWQRYGVDNDDDDGDQHKHYWDLQIPLLIRLRKHELNILAIPESDWGKTKVNSYLLLNALGWSTHVSIRLDVSLRPSQVADLCNNLRDKAYGPPAYRLNGTNMTLKELLAYYRSKLFLDMLSPDTTYSRPGHIPHLIFVDVFHASGEPIPYPEIPVIYLSQMAKIIKRDDVVITMMKDMGGGIAPVIEDMLVTKIDPEFYNFSLTDFDQGSFTYMQTETFDENPTSFSACYANNTRDCFQVSYQWLESYHRLSGVKNAAIQDLLRNGVDALNNLERNYTSRTSARLLQKHKGLKKLLAKSEPVHTNSGDLDGYPN